MSEWLFVFLFLLFLCVIIYVYWQISVHGIFELK
jgi:cbb3-type cytochrome oxidase subunit 3